MFYCRIIKWKCKTITIPWRNIPRSKAGLWCGHWWCDCLPRQNEHLPNAFEKACFHDIQLRFMVSPSVCVSGCFCRRYIKSLFWSSVGLPLLLRSVQCTGSLKNHKTETSSTLPTASERAPSSWRMCIRVAPYVYAAAQRSKDGAPQSNNNGDLLRACAQARIINH